MTCQLYRHFDAEDRLLYVGISISTLTRLAQHRCASHWFDQIAKVTIENYETREDAKLAEVEAIRAERPAYNTQHSQQDFEPVPVVRRVFKAPVIDPADSVRRAMVAADRLKAMGRDHH